MTKPTINISMDSEISQALKEIHGYLDKAVERRQESLRVGTAALFYIFHYAMKYKAKEKIEQEAQKNDGSQGTTEDKEEPENVA